MDHKLATILKEVAIRGGEDASVYENYSGRAMNGQTTTGLVLEHANLATLMFSAAIEISDAMEEGTLDRHLDRDIRSDNLGYNTIYY